MAMMCLRIGLLISLTLSASSLSSSIPSDLIYPEYRVFPQTTLNSQENEFALTGFSISNQRDHLWWRWYMPSFAETHLHGRNLTTKHQINDKFLCHLRMIGMMSSSHDGYEPGGFGNLNILNMSTPIVDLKCYYLFLSRSPRLAVYCPILNPEAEEGLEGSSNSTKTSLRQQVAVNMCSQFMLRLKFTLQVTLLPSHYPRRIPLSTPPHSHLTGVCDVMKKDPYSSSAGAGAGAGGAAAAAAAVVTIREKEKREFSDLMRAPPPPRHHSNHRIAIAVQVFANTVSFAHMHLFLQHYGRLDFTIVIFDRFGLHFEIVRQYLHQFDIRYHPYTLLQVIEPNKYNDSYKDSLVSELPALPSSTSPHLCLSLSLAFRIATIRTTMLMTNPRLQTRPSSSLTHSFWTLTRP
jgi:hypothetical protein